MSRRPGSRLIELATLALATVLTVLAPAGGADYPTDAGPALRAVAHGNLAGFFSHQPAMGAVSLYVRAPFVALAAAVGDGPSGVYRWGDLPCLMSLALLAIWLSRLAIRRRGSRGRDAILTQALIAGVCLLNPLVHDALYWGHPEELLTSSLAVAALLAAYEQRALTAGLLAGLAVASKQWAVLAVAPSVLMLGRGRIQALTAALASAGMATLPMLAADPPAFMRALRYISHPQPAVTPLTWLWPFSPAATVHVSNIFGDERLLRAHRLLGFESLLSRPLIVVLGVGIPVAVWWLCDRRPGAERLLLAAALAGVLRCTLDPGTAAYYHLPIVIVLVALDGVRGRRVPVAGLAAAALAFVVLERFVDYLPIAIANGAYVVSTAAGCALIVGALVGSAPVVDDDRLLRRERNRVVLRLTARVAVSDRIDGLDAGADDYLVKPFDVDELKARLRALLCRSGADAGADGISPHRLAPRSIRAGERR